MVIQPLPRKQGLFFHYRVVCLVLMLLCVLFKQGTTGNPKGATLSHHGILNNAFFVGEILNYDQVHTPLFMSHEYL